MVDGFRRFPARGDGNHVAGFERGVWVVDEEVRGCVEVLGGEGEGGLARGVRVEGRDDEGGEGRGGEARAESGALTGGIG